MEPFFVGLGLVKLAAQACELNNYQIIVFLPSLTGTGKPYCFSYSGVLDFLLLL